MSFSASHTPSPGAPVGRLRAVVGGPARLHVVVVLGCVLALNTADQATVGAVGSELEKGLRIDNTLLGVLAAVAPLMGAVGAIPAGILVDRVNRSRLLAAAILVWSVAMAVSAFSTSYGMLLVVRVALGVVAAVAGPVVASLTGDFFPAAERGRIYGYVLSGELLGAALGFAVSGEVASALSWRWSFGILAVPGIALAWWVLRSLPEPARGGASRIEEGDEEIVDSGQVADAAGPSGRSGSSEAAGASGRSGSSEPAGAAGAGEAARTDPLAERAVRDQHVAPRAETVLRTDPRTMTARAAVRYVLSIPSNRLLIAASALSYFFLEGLETFAVIFLQRRYGIAHSIATLMLAAVVVIAVVGAVAGGRIADAWLARGRADARIVVSGVAFVIAAVVLVPAFALPTIGAGLIFYLVASLAIAAPNPPLDAARLDIVPSGLWGRAEGVRTVIRDFAQGVAPFLFGFVSDRFARPSSDGIATGFGAGSSGTGLEDTFLVMLVPLLLGGVLMFIGRRDYPADVATAIASEREIAAAER